MENKNYYTAVGLFFVTVITCMFIFVWWLGSKTDSNDSYRSYFVHTKELPSGLKEGSVVKFIGVPSGVIKNIGFVNPKEGVIEIELSLKSNLPISKDSLARVETQGLSGISTINISKGGKEPFLESEKPVIKLDKNILEKLGTSAEEISENLNSAMLKVSELISDENIKNINETIYSVKNIAKEIDESEFFSNLSKLSKSLNRVATTLDGNKSGFEPILKNTNELILSLTDSSKKFNSALLGINRNVRSGEYNLREILSPSLVELNIALKELKNTLREFRGALFRLEDNPYDFFFREGEDR